MCDLPMSHSSSVRVDPPIDSHVKVDESGLLGHSAWLLQTIAVAYWNNMLHLHVMVQQEEHAY